MTETSDGNDFPIAPYGSFTEYTPALPQFYWDVYSAEQRIKHMCYEIEKCIDYADMLGLNLNITHDDVAKLQADFKKFMESGFEDYYEQKLEEWIRNNVAEIFNTLAKMVFFGLTDDGYFCAYIPDSWSDITFDTGAVYGRADYGRLILRFDADGTGVIDNLYDNKNFNYEEFKNLESQVKILNQQVLTALSKIG